jgi:signal transduction histidine kinase
VQGIARDITDRTRAREALHRLNETREEEAKGIAHALHDEASQLLAVVHIAVAELSQELPPSAQKHVLVVGQNSIRRSQPSGESKCTQSMAFLDVLGDVTGAMRKRWPAR